VADDAFAKAEKRLGLDIPAQNSAV
jgi:hypothetical protein